MGPRTWEFVQTLRTRRRDGQDERGAELIEFAIVVVLLITLLYGIITYGLILAAQSTITQAAADGTRAGIVEGTGTADCGTDTTTPVSIAGCTAVGEAANDLGWMDKGACAESVNGTSVQTGAGAISCSANTENCPSNVNATCLAVTVSYNYASSPLFPELPGLSVISPSTLSSTNVLQLSTPSS